MRFLFHPAGASADTLAHMVPDQEGTNATIINGYYLVTLPVGIPFDVTGLSHPVALSTVVSSKYQLLMEQQGLGNRIDNELVTVADIASIDTADPNHRALVGIGKTISLPPTENGVDGVVTTTTTVIGGPATDFIVYWECYSIVKQSDTDSGPAARLMREEDPANFTVELSADAGGSWTTVSYLSQVTLVAGTQIKLRVTNSSSERYWLGGYCIMY